VRSAYSISAVAITIGFILADAIPGALAEAYTESLGPLCASAWLASLARRWWRSVEGRVLALPTPNLLAGLTIAVLVLLLGAVRLIWADPWLFAPMLWPLVEVLLTLRRRRRATGAIF
jgi:hypothetical protein